MDAREHWETVYETKASNAVSWFRPHLETSLTLIERTSVGLSASIIDIGGGESTLVDDLLARGYRDITVLDISQTALEVTKRRLGAAASQVRWLCGDITDTDLLPDSYDIWHDRAVFHFLGTVGQRSAYVQRALSAIKSGGYLIISTFALNGPSQCSGLDVVRYDAQSLHVELGRDFRLADSFEELHETPFGTTQQFLYCCYQRE